MKDKPLVSILAPCYNVEKFLPHCLDSIINQTYNNLQIVMIDDGSKDGTWSILQEYAAKYPQTLQTSQTNQTLWIEIYHQENQGVAATRNALLSKIKGDYFLFIDSDDWIELDMVEFLLKRATQEDADMVVCGMVKNDDTPSTSFSEEMWTKEHAVKEFLRHVSFNGSLWNKLTNVTLLHNEPRFHCGISYGEDALFCWELLKEAENGIIATNKQLYHYRMNANSLSHANWVPEKKGSGSMVWELISTDASKTWPQYADIVNARYAIEDMWGIYYASLADYPFDEEIAKRQKHVRESLGLIKRSKLISKNKLLFAWITSRWYGFGWLLRTIRNIKGQDK